MPRPLQLNTSPPAGFGPSAVGRSQQLAQVLVGRLGVADVELDRLAATDPVGDGQGPGPRVEADQVADQEVAAAELVAVLVDRQADEQPLLHQLLVAPAAPRSSRAAQVVERRLAADLGDDVVLPLGDDQRPADRAGTPATPPS